MSEKRANRKKIFACFLFACSSLFSNLHAADIAMLVVAVGDEYQKAVAPGYENKMNYCERHGYDFIYVNQSLDTSRHPAWSKIKALQNILREKKHKWVFVNDADSIVMNQAVNLEDLIDENYEIVMTKDVNGLNSGQMLVKNDAWSELFLEKVYAHTEYISHPWWEQKAIMQEYDQNEETRRKIKILPQRAMNSYSEEALNELRVDVTQKLSSYFQPGDFMVHFPALRDSLPNFMEKYAKASLCNDKLINLDAYLGYHNYKLSPVHSHINEGYCTVTQQRQMRDDLSVIGPNIKKIIEVGFNAGHSCELFMQECPNAELLSFDLNEHPYTKVGVEFMKRKYKNRFTFIPGDSHITLAHYLREHPYEKADLIYIDGDHSTEGCYLDIMVCRRFATPNTIVWLDDYSGTVARAVDRAAEQGYIKIIASKEAHDPCGGRQWVHFTYTGR